MRFREQSDAGKRGSWTDDRSRSNAPPSGGLGLILEWCSLLIAVVTICILPWLLGGAVPRAGLFLQAGTFAAAILTILARLVSGRSFALPPLGTAVLLGMAAIGLTQLQPWLPSAISMMDHSVYPEFRAQLPRPEAPETNAAAKRFPAASRSVAPARTRRHVAQWIAVAVLLCVVADSLTRSDQLLCILGLLCLNAGCLTILSLQQLLGKGGRGLTEAWNISDTKPFGPFVNPNNAAGWLLVHVALAIGLVVVVWGRNPPTGWSHSFKRPSWQDRLFATLTIARHRLASLNNIQILSMVTVVLLLTGVAATLSRAGIVAGIFGLVVCAASLMQWKQSLLLLVPVSILLTGVSLTLTAFDLDTRVLAELMTLKDPVSESTSRLLHWTDSLSSLRDFPWLGSGQGAYAWATLPYLEHGTSTWFMNADNQYVEILVESGILGLMLFAGFGLLLTVQSLQLIRSKARSRSHNGLWSHRVAVGLAGTTMLASQAVAAFFDFGIGRSSTMSAIAVFGGILAASHRSHPGLQTGAPTWFALDGGFVGWTLRVALAAAVYGSVPELIQADRAHPAIVESARFLAAPVTRETLERLPAVQEQLTTTLRLYPDDAIVRDYLVRIVEARFRWRLIDEMDPPEKPMDEKQLQAAWRDLTPLGLAERMTTLQKNLDPQDFRALQVQMTELAQELPWIDMAREAVRRMPLGPGLAVDAAAGATSLGKFEETQLNQLQSVRFTDAAGARRLFQCGRICLLTNRQEQAVEFWNQSLQVSELFRINILMSVLSFRTPEQALDIFPPTEYTATVKAALTSSTPELQAGLWRIADAQWLTVSANPNADQRLQRARHLARRGSPEELLKWIDECLSIDPTTLELRQMRASTLETQGKLDEAIGEWMRYEHFDSNSKLPSRSIKRLMDRMEAGSGK
jgi:O-antigen ligase/tetratricopeptide (TPR) repeat protein